MSVFPYTLFIKKFSYEERLEYTCDLYVSFLHIHFHVLENENCSNKSNLFQNQLISGQIEY